MRENGKRVGVIKLWQYRPFPTTQVANLLSNLKCVGILDRSVAFGAPYGPLCSDVASTKVLTGIQTKIFNVICGLGGRDVRPVDIEAVLDRALRHARGEPVEEPVSYAGVRT